MGDTIEYNIRADTLSPILNIVKDHDKPWEQVNFFYYFSVDSMWINSQFLVCCFEI